MSWACQNEHIIAQNGMPLFVLLRLFSALRYMSFYCELRNFSIAKYAIVDRAPVWIERRATDFEEGLNAFDK